MSLPQQTQVALIGGGLAGLSAAVLLARAGRQVVVLEKGSYPRHKVCGEYLSLESWRLLEHLGAPLAELGPPIIRRLGLSTHLGGYFSTSLPLGGFGLSRYTLDHALAKAARQAGALVVEQAEVKRIGQAGGQYILQTTQGELQAAVAVGTFGKRSGLEGRMQRRHLRRKPNDRTNYVGVKHHFSGDFPNDLIELHLFPEGYAGISRVEEGRICCCYMTSARMLKRYGGIAALEQQLLGRNARLAHYLNTLHPLYSQPLTISNIRFTSRRMPEEGMMMAGDAAGLAAPLTGNGMSMALQAGWLLAQHLNPALEPTTSQADQPFSWRLGYRRAWRSQFSTRLAVGRLLQEQFFSPALLSAAFPLFRRAPGLARSLIRLTHGREFLPSSPVNSPSSSQ